MDDYNRNAWGIQKTKPTEVISDNEIAGSTAMSALDGVQKGAKYGPYGAAIGGLAYGTAAYLGSTKRKKEQEFNRGMQEHRNADIDKLAGYAASRDNTYIGMQARDGFKYQDGGQPREVELEGGKAYGNNGGEIYGTPKYRNGKLTKFNIKGVTNGEESHENGGVTIPTTKYRNGGKASKYEAINLDTDVVLPTQKDPKEQAKISRLIKSANLGNSKDAMKLQRYINKLPSVDETGQPVAEDGLRPVSNSFQDPSGAVDPKDFLSRNVQLIKGLSNYKIKKMTDEQALSYYNDQIKNNPNLDPRGQGIFPEQEGMSLDELTSVNSANVKANNKARAAESNILDGYRAELQAPEENISRDTQLHHEVQRIRNSMGDNPSAAEWNKALDEGLKGTGLNKKDVHSYMANQGLDVGSYNKNSTGFGKLSTGNANELWNKFPEPKAPTDDINNEDTTKKIEDDLKRRGTVDETIQPNRYETSNRGNYVNPPTPEETYQIPETPHYNNPLKYASIYNNMMVGNSPIDPVTRRFDKWDDIKYKDYSEKDYSESQRQATVEGREYAQRANRNNVNRSLSHASNSQIGAQYNRQMEGINEREAAKAFETDKYNQQMHNQYAAKNLDRANAYDEQDDMTRAIKQRYTDTAYSEISQAAQVGETDKYLRARNEKQDAIQMATLGLMGTQNFDSVYENGQFKTRYNGRPSTNSNVKTPPRYNGDGTWTDMVTGETFDARTNKKIG